MIICCRISFTASMGMIKYVIILKQNMFFLSSNYAMKQLNMTYSKHVTIQVVFDKATAVEAFGEIGVLYHVPQPFTVRTTELSQILRINRTSLMNVLQANPGDAQIVMNNLLMVIKILKASKLKTWGIYCINYIYQSYTPSSMIVGC